MTEDINKINGTLKELTMFQGGVIYIMVGNVIPVWSNFTVRFGQQGYMAYGGWGLCKALLAICQPNQKECRNAS